MYIKNGSENMEYKKMLFSKNGLTTMQLAKGFIKCQIGEKIPTITELSERYPIARGTIQNSIKMLQNAEAIRLEARGHLGTFLIAKDMSILLKLAGITSLVGVMPLPYSKRYEGFSTGIIVALENQYNVPISMAYMRGAQNRIGMLLSDRYDFAIISKYAALKMIEKGNYIRIVKSFGPYSYLSRHVVVFHDEHTREIQDGMKIGIDKDSVDQSSLTERICKGKNVQFVHIEYSQIIRKIKDGTIDAAVWNEDEITDNLLEVNYTVLEQEDLSDTEAVLVVDVHKTEVATLLDEIVDVETVLENQKLVMEGKIAPSY